MSRVTGGGFTVIQVGPYSIEGQSNAGHWTAVLPSGEEVSAWSARALERKVRQAIRAGRAGAPSSSAGGGSGKAPAGGWRRDLRHQESLRGRAELDAERRDLETRRTMTRSARRNALKASETRQDAPGSTDTVPAVPSMPDRHEAARTAIGRWTPPAEGSDDGAV